MMKMGTFAVGFIFCVFIILTGIIMPALISTDKLPVIIIVLTVVILIMIVVPLIRWCFRWIAKDFDE